MITEFAASAPNRTPLSAAAPVPDKAIPGVRGEQVVAGIAYALEVDRITLTQAAHLDLHLRDAGALLRDMDALLLATSGSAAGPATMNIHDLAQLVHATRGVATAVEAVSDAGGIMVGKGLTGRAERVVVLVAHASSSLQALIVRLMLPQATDVGALPEHRVASFQDRDRTGGAETVRPGDEAACASAGRIATDIADPPAIAAALATIQEIATRLAQLQTTLPTSGTSTASPPLRQAGEAISGENGKVRRPVLPGLVCVLVALMLLQRIDPGPVQHIATLLALPMVLAWCGHWLARRWQNDTRQQMALRQDEVLPESLDTSLSITDASRVGHAPRAASSL